MGSQTGVGHRFLVEYERGSVKSCTAWPFDEDAHARPQPASLVDHAETYSEELATQVHQDLAKHRADGLDRDTRVYERSNVGIRTRIVARLGCSALTRKCCSLQPSHGLITAAPAASKGPVSRLATVNPLAAAVAAM